MPSLLDPSRDQGLVRAGCPAQVRHGLGAALVGPTRVEAQGDPGHLGEQVSATSREVAELGDRRGGAGLVLPGVVRGRAGQGGHEQAVTVRCGTNMGHLARIKHASDKGNGRGARGGHALVQAGAGPAGGDLADQRAPTWRAFGKAAIETSDGPRTCYEARKHREGKKDLVARFGGTILRQDRRAVIRDPAPGPALYPRKELISRLRRRECELCETGTTVTVHQVTGLKALGEPGPGQPAWAALMAKMRRKTLIVCAACHDCIHANPVAHAA